MKFITKLIKLIFPDPIIHATGWKRPCGCYVIIGKDIAPRLWKTKPFFLEEYTNPRKEFYKSKPCEKHKGLNLLEVAQKENG